MLAEHGHLPRSRTSTTATGSPRRARATAGRPRRWPRTRATTEAQRAPSARPSRPGVRIAYGTDSGVYPHPMVAIQLGYQVRLGQTPLQALRSATLTAAELHGLGGPRRVAAARAASRTSWRWRADPLVDIEVLRRPATVVKGGVPVD